MRAVVSLGTNTVRMLAVRDETDGSVTQLQHLARGTRLGEGLSDEGDLAPAAMERTLDVAREFAESARSLGANAVACIATSAMRRANNAADFAAQLEREAGLKLRVLDGHEEAAASFRGATYATPRDGRRVAVLDIGGGSTECAVGRDGVLEVGRSFELGTVRITEAFPHLNGLSRGRPAIDAPSGAARALLAPLTDLAPVDELICVAGTPLTLAAVAYRKTVETVVGLHLARGTVDETVGYLLTLALDARRALPGMIPQRADLLPGGGIILSEAMALLGVDRARLESNDLLLGFLLER